HATGNVTTGAQFISTGTASNSFSGSLELTKGLRFGNLTQTGSALNYFAGNVGIGTTSPASFKLEVAGNIGPDADGTRDLGSSARKWNNLYVNNLAFSTASVSGNFDPASDNQYDLGDPSYRWRTGYFGTSIVDSGTLSVTGRADFGSNVSVSGDFEVGTDKFRAYGATGNISTAGGYAQTGTTANTFTGTTTFSNGTYSALFTGGNVGVGTTVPIAKLDIVGDFAGNTGPLFRVASSSELFRIQENGNVGINSGGSLDTKFEVGGTASVSGTLTLAGIITSTNTGSNSFQGSLEVTKGVHATGNVTTGAQFISTGAASNSFSGSLELAKGLNVANGTLRVTTNGNVGIGTTSPGALLHLYSTGNPESYITFGTATNNYGRQVFYSGTNAKAEFGYSGSAINAGFAAGMSKTYIAYADNFALGTVGATSPDMVIKSGNVGIGTTSPTSFKLEVAGNIGPDADGTRDLGS
ncbi:MAG: hypothetical protein Q8K86_06975, partial [Candidatus Nanopelagicaceae bacterium]|nr:hypothetical protein [Candidatus Nanopelagicaceae bacterium]